MRLLLCDVAGNQVCPVCTMAIHRAILRTKHNIWTLLKFEGWHKNKRERKEMHVSSSLHWSSSDFCRNNHWIWWLFSSVSVALKQKIHARFRRFNNTIKKRDALVHQQNGKLHWKRRQVQKTWSLLLAKNKSYLFAFAQRIDSVEHKQTLHIFHCLRHRCQLFRSEMANCCREYAGCQSVFKCSWPLV